MKNTSNPKSKDEGEHPCTANGWPKRKIGEPVCRSCDDKTCYKFKHRYDSIKPIEIKKPKPKFAADEFQEILE